ncbi:MAG: NHL repeat-containing protein, partial [Candidatus Micrarchaeota archaeon]
MKGGIAAIALLLLASAAFAELTYVKETYVKDIDKWLNLSSPSDVWQDKDTLYVLDTGNSRILEFFNGDPVKITSGGGSIFGMLYPRAFYFGDDGRTYIANSGANNVVAYENGNYIYGIAISGTDSYSFEQPLGVIVYNGMIYVSDTGRATVKKFSLRDRTYQGEIGTRGFGEDQLAEPAGLSSMGGLLYVADRGNSRIQVFSEDGKHVQAIRGSYDCGLNSPQGVAVSKDGFIFVSDTGNGRIVVFDKNWKCVDKVNSTPKGPLSGPRGIRVDSSHNVYVADTGNARVVFFHYTPYYESKSEASGKIVSVEALQKAIDPAVLAANHVGIAFENPGEEILDVARSELSKGNYGNAYFNATLASEETLAFNSSLNLKIHSAVLKALLEDEQTLDKADSEAARYSLDIDSSPLRAEIARVRMMLDNGRFVDAAFNSTQVHSRVISFISSISGSSTDSAKTRDELLLAVSDARNELSEAAVSASQYILDINYTSAATMLDGAKDACNRYDFDS